MADFDRHTHTENCQHAEDEPCTKTRIWKPYWFHKEVWLQEHERAQFNFMIESKLIGATWGKEGEFSRAKMESDTASDSAADAPPPLSELEATTLSNIFPNERSYGKALIGRWCVKPHGHYFQITTVFEDINKNAIRVLLYDVVSPDDVVSGPAGFLPDLEQKYPSGMRVAIKEPLLKVCSDGKMAIRVDGAASICCMDESSLEPGSSTSVIRKLDGIRSEGNAFFGKGKWIEAMDKYTCCIGRTEGFVARNLEDKFKARKLNKKDKKDWEKFKNIFMLAHSNRAEVNLRLTEYHDALTDAHDAFRLDPTNIKALVRKGKAAHGLRLFGGACKIFEKALEKRPCDPSITQCLTTSTASLLEKIQISDSAVIDKTSTSVLQKTYVSDAVIIQKICERECKVGNCPLTSRSQGTTENRPGERME